MCLRPLEENLPMAYCIVVINVRKKIKNVNKRVFYEKKIKKTFVNVIKKRYPIFTCF